VRNGAQVGENVRKISFLKLQIIMKGEQNLLPALRTWAASATKFSSRPPNRLPNS
jgi:hypothetical protein